MPNFDEIMAFVRVVETRSFVAAAQSLGVSPSATSKAVTRLEERLGTRLLNRTTRSLSLTDVGSTFYERCRDVLSRMEEAEGEVADSRATPRGRLRIDLPLSFGRSIVVPALPRFLEQFPELQLQISFNDRLVDLVQDGIDAAVRVGELADSSLVARRVGSLRVVTCASPEFLARNGEPHSPQEIQPDRCIGLFNLSTGQIREWTYARAGVEQTIVPASRLHLTDAEAAVRASIGGGGFVRVLSTMTEEPIAAGLLKAVLTDWDQGTRAISVVYPRHRQPTQKIKVFADFIAGLMPAETGAV